MGSQARRQIVFTLGMLIVGGLEAVVAHRWVGTKGVEGVAISVLLCMVPGWLTIYVSDLLKHRDLGAYAVLVGTAFRMLFVLLGLFAVGAALPGLGFREFTIWLIIGYFVSLALETWMVLLPSPSKASQ